MIIFDLQCTCGCQFEGWFAGRSDFDRQICTGQITCPHCGGREGIRKILSPVTVCTGPAQKEVAPTVKKAQQQITPEMTLQVLRSVQEYVENNFENVGARLATESLKIHYGVEKQRNIRGVVTADEEKMLRDEGIELLKIPLVKKSSDPELN